MIKKIMVLFFVSAMTLMTTSASWAALNTFSVNVTSGDAKVEDSSDDLKQITLGLTVPINYKLEFNGELSKGDIDDNNSNETTTVKLKGDYQIYQDRTTKLTVSGGYYQRNEDWRDYKISSLLVGINGRVKLNRKLSVYSGLNLGLLPKEEWDNGDGDVKSLYLFHLKFNYLLNPKLGLSAGYFSEKFESDEWQDTRYNGLTAGVFIRF